MKTGKNAPRKITNTFDGSPRPNQTIAIGIQASGGIGRSSRRSGRTMRPSRDTSRHATPSAMPATRAEREAGDDAPQADADVLGELAARQAAATPRPAPASARAAPARRARRGARASSQQRRATPSDAERRRAQLASARLRASPVARSVERSRACQGSSQRFEPREPDGDQRSRATPSTTMPTMVMSVR